MFYTQCFFQKYYNPVKLKASTSYTILIFSTPDFRNAFLKTIRQIIRESVRNMNLPGPEGIASCSSVGTRMKQYPEVISQEREPIRTRQTYREIKEDRSSRGVHYSPHMTSREYKDDHRQIIERNAIGKKSEPMGMK